MESITAIATATVEKPAKTVWEVMKRFGDLSWTEGIDEVVVEGKGIGMVRKVRLTGSTDWIVERLTEQDDVNMQFSYAIEGEGMPGLNDYTATGQAIPVEGSCRIRWECRAFTNEDQAADARQLIEGIASGIVTLFAAQFP